MIDRETFEQLASLAYEWARAQEEIVLAHGAPLSSRSLADAHLAGVQDCERIRVLILNRIPLPESGELAEAARRAHIISEDTRCVGFGHAIMIRAEAWGDRELLVHNFVHVAQCERSGGLKSWVQEYLFDRVTCATFSLGSLEEEARRLAREICSAEMPVTI